MENVGPSRDLKPGVDLSYSQTFGTHHEAEILTASAGNEWTACSQTSLAKEPSVYAGETNCKQLNSAETNCRLYSGGCVRKSGETAAQDTKGLRQLTGNEDIGLINLKSDADLSVAADLSTSLLAREDGERVAEGVETSVKYDIDICLPPKLSAQLHHHNVGQLSSNIQCERHQQFERSYEDGKFHYQHFSGQGNKLQQYVHLQGDHLELADIGSPSYHKPKEPLLLPHGSNNVHLIPEINLMVDVSTIKSDSQALFNKKSERSRHEFRQQQIQQWVLKHDFSQESVSSECWLGQYPQISLSVDGNEEENRETMHILTSVKVEGIADNQRQESNSTQSFFKGPTMSQVFKNDQQQSGCKSNKSATHAFDLVHEAAGASEKRQKMDIQMADLNEQLVWSVASQGTKSFCQQHNSTSVAADMHLNDVESRSDPTLRQWLSKPARVVDQFACLHIFKQILEFVDLAHSQGVILRNVRPSSFILSAFHRVSFIDSASSRSSSGSSDLSTGTDSIQASPVDRGGLDDGIHIIHDETKNMSPAKKKEQQSRQYLQLLEEENCSEWLTNEVDPHQANVFSEMPIFHNNSKKELCGASELLLGMTKKANLSNQQSSSSGYRKTSADICNSSLLSQNPLSVGKLDILKGDSMVRSGTGIFNENGLQDIHFPVRQTLLMEETWYASPEEILDGTCSYASDVYSLGVLFFELFCPFSSWEEHSKVMLNLRHRILPPGLLCDRPKESAFCLWLLHPEPNSRPKAREVLLSEILGEVGEALAERQAAVNIEEKEAEAELLLDFLLRLQQQKQQLVSKLLQVVSSLTSDIEEAKKRCALLQQKGINPVSVEEEQSSKLTRDNSESKRSMGPTGTLLRNSGAQVKSDTVNMSRLYGEPGQVEPRNKGMHRLIESSIEQENLLSKSARLMGNFEQLEKVYFTMRWTLQNQVPDTAENQGSQKQETSVSNTAASVFDLDKEVKKLGQVKDEKTHEKDWLGFFFDSLCKYARYSRFEVKATLQHGDLLNTSNMVCSLSFDRDQEYFATAGVCKRIKVFECDAVLNEDAYIHYPVAEMTSRSKVSSICWNSYIKSHISSGEYNGVVQLWDANTGQSFMQYCEHEKRVWSVDFSQADPTKLASGSDDGSVKLWNINQEGSIETIKTKANICCVQFSKDSAHLIAFGSADYKIHCYDLRNTRAPWCTLINHSKAVSYVKFVDAVTLVSASTDNTLKLWDLLSANSSGGVSKACLLTYSGHTNEKNFVGLSVMDGYIACGSETNSVFAYHKSLPMPMASHKFNSAASISDQETEDDSGHFVSCVCWRGKTQTLVAGNSIGNIEVLEMV